MKTDSLLPKLNFEMRFWLILLLLPNIGLLLGNLPAVNLTFDASAVANGEWWRYLTWPWVHVSRYHLILDGVAFLTLYTGLEEKQSMVRFAYLLGAIAGSLILPLMISADIYHIGLCGLSGVAHGLFAISALEMMRKNGELKVGVMMLLGLLVKTGWELYSGQAFLQNLHFGNIGQPIVSTHAGGILGALLFYGGWHALAQYQRRRTPGKG